PGSNACALAWHRERESAATGIRAALNRPLHRRGRSEQYRYGSPNSPSASRPLWRDLLVDRRRSALRSGTAISRRATAVLERDRGFARFFCPKRLLPLVWEGVGPQPHIMAHYRTRGEGVKIRVEMYRVAPGDFLQPPMPVATMLL